MPPIFAIAPLLAADGPKFEAASVKRADQCAMDISVDAGRVALIGVPLKVVLMQAFNVKLDQIAGPSWLESDCYTVVAKIPEGATKDQLPAMFEALVVERFKLASHKESRARQGYALTVDKDGPKFKEASPSLRAPGGQGGQVRFGAAQTAASFKGAMTMASLARSLSTRLDAPVEDATGLKGTYDIDVTWVPDPSLEKPGLFAQTAAASGNAEASVPAGAANIFTAFRESLGLKLEPHKIAVEMVVIEHIERVPVDN
jgi:uncharacterized protein (TIGR03435 family)